MTAPLESDGHLPAARQALANAISALIDPKPETRNLDNGQIRIEWLDRLHDQLTDATPGSQGNATRTPQSSPPVCIDAVDLLTHITHTTATWEPRPHIDASQNNPEPIALIRLRALDTRTWRPQDTTHINTITNEITSWCNAIREMLTPQRKWTLPAACPACGTKTVYRKNSADEVVRKPALTIGPGGCECQHCRAYWGPDKFVFLSKVLGSLPENVLE